MNFANAGQSTLLSAVLSGDLTITVVSATPFPAAPFHVVVDQELMTVTAVAGTTFTVTRGIEGTTAAAHAAGATVTNTVTAGDFAGFGGTTSPLTTKGDLWGYDSGNNRVPVGADGLVLTADSTQALGVKWKAAAGGTLEAGWMHNSAAQTINNATVTLVNLDTSDLATANVTCDTVNHKITVNFTGYVQVQMGVYWNTQSGAAGSFYLRCTQNATIIMEEQFYEVAGSNPGASESRNVACASGDVFEFFVANFTGANEQTRAGDPFLQVTQLNV